MTIDLQGNNRWADLSQQFLDASQAFDAAKAKLDAVKSEIEDAAATHMMEGKEDTVSGHLLTVKRIERKGNVDYSRIPELFGVDLDQYRRPGSEFLKVTRL